MSTVHCQKYECIYNNSDEAECQKEHILIEDLEPPVSPRCISWAIDSSEKGEVK